MKKIGYVGFICLFGLLLTACGHSEGIEETTRESIASVSATTAINDAYMTVSGAEATYATTGKLHFEWTGAIYEGIRFYGNHDSWIERIVSDETSVILPSHVPEQGNMSLYPLNFEMICPNLKELTVKNGYEVIRLPRGNSDIYRTEILTLPQGFELFSYLDSDIHALGYYDDPLHTPFPTEFAELREICVKYEEYGDPIWTTDGMLYAMRTLGTNSQSVLVCLPRNYPSEDGTVTLPERTAIIQTHAIYHCRNIDRLTIPKMVGKIDPEGIVATAEYPLTVVCAKGSAADEYVRLYGEQFHLTAEYLPE